jgi:hypothetical protein
LRVFMTPLQVAKKNLFRCSYFKMEQYHYVPKR